VLRRNRQYGICQPRTMATPRDATKSSTHSRRRLPWPWIVPGAILGLTAIGYWLIRTLPSTALSQLERLTNTDLACTSFQVHADGSVAIEDLTIRPNEAAAYDNAILNARHVRARFSMWSLLLLHPQLKDLTIQDFTLQAKLDLDTGRWNIGTVTLAIPKGHGRGMPDIHLIGGTLKYVKRSGGRDDAVAAIPIDATFALNRLTARGYEFEVTTEEIRPGMGSSVLSGYWKPGQVIITGGIKSKTAPYMETSFAVDAMAVVLTYDPNENYRLQVQARDLFSSRSPQADVFGLIQPVFFGDSNPVARVQKFFSRFEPSGKADIHLQAQGNLNQILRSRCQGAIDCKDVVIRDRRFPYMLEHVSGKIEFTEDTFRTQRLVGRHRDVEVLIDFWTQGLGPDWQYEVHVGSTRMPLDQDLFAALGPTQKRLWSAFDPNGSIAMQYQASRQSSNQERESLLVKPLGATAAYEQFPYPLRNLTGELLFEEDRVVLSNLLSDPNTTTTILLDGTVTQLDSNNPDFDLAIQAHNIPLDETLAQSLGPARRAQYDPLCMAGRVDAAIKVFTDPNEPILGGVSFRAELTLKDASMKVCNGRAQLDHGSGHALLTPTSVVLKDLACQYRRTPIRLNGTVFMGTPSAPASYQWSLQAEQIPIDDLLAALPPVSQETVDQFHPSGQVDVTANLDKPDPNSPLMYHVQVNCLNGRMIAESFPYPFRDVTGTITLTNDRIVLDAIRARPDTAVIPSSQSGLLHAAGQIEVSPRGIEAGNLNFTAENIEMDQTLGEAMPSPLAAWFRQLAPSGRFGLDRSDIRIATEDDGSVRTDLEAQLCLDGCRLNLLGTTAACRGTLQISGVHRTGRGLSEGQIRMDMDRITLKGKSATDVHTVIRYEPPTHTWHTEDVLGRFYEGRIIGRCEIGQRPNDDVECQIDLGFVDTDLGAFLGDRTAPLADAASPSTGSMDGQLSLIASLRGPKVRIGECRFHIRNMQVGKASPLSKVLAVLRLSEPSDYVFESLQVDSYIRGDKLLIEAFDMSGTSTAFQGAGVLDLAKEDLNLTLMARSRRRLATAEPTALQSLTEGLGGAVVRMEITGPPYDPNVTTKPLPVLEESLKLLGSPP